MLRGQILFTISRCCNGSGAFTCKLRFFPKRRNLHPIKSRKLKMETITDQHTRWKNWITQFSQILPTKGNRKRCSITARHLTIWRVWFNTDICSTIPIAVSSCLLFIITQYDLLYGLLLTVLYTVYCVTQWIAVSWRLLTVLLISEMLMTNCNVYCRCVWLGVKIR